MSTILKTNINPTEGLVEYTKTVKPYHSKILEVNVDYVYTDAVNVTVNDNIKWGMSITLPYAELLRSCGWGIEWDPIRTTQDYPSVKILRSYGDVVIQAAIQDNSNEIAITYNPDSYILNVNDPVVFSTSNIMPRLTVSETISPGLVYYIVDVQPNVIKISRTLGGTPIMFLNGGMGTLSIKPANLPYNSFEVEKEAAPLFEFVVADVTHNYMSFVNNYTIIAVDPLLQTWTVDEDLVTNERVLPGNKIFVRDNTGVGGNGTYTIVSSVLVGTNTVITISEPISLQANGDGILGVTFNEIAAPVMPVPALDGATRYWPTPSWAIGTKVHVSSSDRLPYPLEVDTDYFYVPMTNLGIFALSKKRFPTDISDLIQINSDGVGFLTIHRAETFYPGATIKVDSSYLSRNNGIYYIQNTVELIDPITELPTGVIRISVVQKVTRTTPSTVPYDGIASIISDGWDYPFYCPLIQSDELYTETFIEEKLWFEFDTAFHDYVGAETIENSDTVVLASSPGYTILMTGYDTQPFGTGSMEENIDTLPGNI